MYLLLTIFLVLSTPFLVSSSELELKKLTNECCSKLCTGEKLSNLHDILASYSLTATRDTKVTELAHAVLGGKQCKANELLQIDSPASQTTSNKSKRGFRRAEHEEAQSNTLPLKSLKIGKEQARRLHSNNPRAANGTGEVFISCPSIVYYPASFSCSIYAYSDSNATLYYVEAVASPYISASNNVHFISDYYYYFDAYFNTEGLTSTNGYMTATIYGVFYLNSVPFEGGYTTWNVTIYNIPYPSATSTSSYSSGTTGTTTGSNYTTTGHSLTSSTTGGNYTTSGQLTSSTSGGNYTTTGYTTTGGQNPYVYLYCPQQVPLNEYFSCQVRAYSPAGFWFLAGYSDGSIACIDCSRDAIYTNYIETNFTYKANGYGSVVAYFYDTNYNYYTSQVAYIQVVYVPIQMLSFNAPQTVLSGPGGSVSFSVSFTVKSFEGPLSSATVYYQSDSQYLPPVNVYLYDSYEASGFATISSNGNPVTPGLYCPAIFVQDWYGWNRWFYPACTRVINVECDAGYYISTKNNVTYECIPCPVGFYSPNYNSLSCSACPPGTTSSCYAGSRSCLACPAGTSSDNGLCKKCAAGSFAASEGQPECDPCPAGSYYNLTGATSCLPCSSGTYSCAGASTCNACQAGTYATPGAEACTKCSSGFYSYPSSSFCIACPENTYSLHGAGGCTPCPYGKHSPAERIATIG